MEEKKKEGQGQKERAGEYHYKHNEAPGQVSRKDPVQRCKPIQGAHGTSEWLYGVRIRGSRCL